MSGEWVFNLYIFVLATFVGYQVISRVPPLLHTPLMSGTNAISGISLVASLLAAGLRPFRQPGARLRRGHVRVDQRRRGLSHHGSHAADVQEEAAGGRGQGEARGREGVVTPTMLVLSLCYLVAAVLFILCLRGLSSPEGARRGLVLGEVGMLIAVVGTLLHKDIIRYEWILAGVVVGSGIGVAISAWIPMTKMPERIALSHSFGGLATALVGVAEYLREVDSLTYFKVGALGFETFLGFLTFTGSIMAFGKLQGFISGAPITWKGQNFVNIGLFAGSLVAIGVLVFNRELHQVFFAIAGTGFRARRHGRAPDRRRRYAGRDLAPQLVRGARRVRDGLRAGESDPHHLRRPRRLIGLAALAVDEQGDEPLVREHHLRRLRHGARARASPGRRS